jgi:hypothetical protein
MNEKTFIILESSGDFINVIQTEDHDGTPLTFDDELHAGVWADKNLSGPYQIVELSI